MTHLRPGTAIRLRGSCCMCSAEGPDCDVLAARNEVMVVVSAYTEHGALFVFVFSQDLRCAGWFVASDWYYQAEVLWQ